MKTEQGASTHSTAAPSFEPVDALAGILRAFGRHAFATEHTPVEQFERACRAWANHLLRGTAPPGHDEDQGGAWPVGRRALRDAVRFFTQRRVEEARHVGESAGAARAAMLQLVGGLREALAQDEAIDEGIEVRLAALEDVARSGSMEALQAELPRAVGGIREALVARKAGVRRKLTDLGRQISALREDLRETKREADRDALTQLYNRGAFTKAFERTLRLSIARGEPLTLVLIDLDHFKSVNDTYGHPAGDAVLQMTADTLIRAFPRASDVVARYGGEEFAILLSDVDVQMAAGLIDRLLSRLRDVVVPWDGHAISVTASVGYAERREAESAALFVQRADKALYEAKHSGRDRAVAG